MQLLKSAVMGIFWTWILLISAVVQLPVLSTAPIRFTSYIPDGATTVKRVTKHSTVTRMTQVRTAQRQVMFKNMEGEEELALTLEDYKSIDPPPQSDTPKVKPSPIENGDISAPSLDTTTLIKT